MCTDTSVIYHQELKPLYRRAYTQGTQVHTFELSEHGLTFLETIRPV